MKNFALLMSLFFSLTAAPVGNPAAAALIRKGCLTTAGSSMSLRLGYEGDFVTDAKLEQFNQGTGRVDQDRQETQSATATLNFVNRLDLYGIFGASEIKANWRFEDVAAETISRVGLGTERSFLWGGGARAILYEWYHTFLGLGGRYSSCHYPLDWLHINGDSQSVSGAHCQWQQWQVNLDLAYKIKIFTPYIGVKYSQLRTFLTDFPVPISANLTGSNSFQNRVPVGFYLGCSLCDGRYVLLNLEGRLVDEEAISVSADLKF